MIESCNRRQLSKQREKVVFNEVLATQISERIGAMFSKSAKVRTIQELVPPLFEQMQTDNTKQEHQWREHMQRMREFTIRHNQERRMSDGSNI